MKAVLAAVNAKYIHSNPAVYSLRAYAQAQGAGGEVEIGEYTINHRREDVLRDLFQRSPQLVGFSCYIWNISMIRALIADLALILPDTAVWLGGRPSGDQAPPRPKAEEQDAGPARHTSPL